MSSAIKESKELPKGWNNIAYLPEIVLREKNAIKRGPFGSALKKSFFVKDGYKIYEQKNVIRNNFEIGDYYINEQKFNELEDFEIKPNDILISCSGTIGKIVVVPQNIKRGIINQALLKLSLNNQKVLNDYFVYFFKNYVQSGELENKGAAIQNIASVSELKKIPIPLPEPKEQQRIVEKLDSLFERIDKAITLSSENLTHANNLLPAALNEVFENAEEKGWVIETWENTVVIKNGKNQKAVEDKNGKYPIYGSGGIMSYANDFICNENTTIIGRKGTINKPIYVQEKFWNVDTAFGIEAGKKIDSKFLHYFCLSYDFTLHNKSTTLPSLAKTDLLKILMPFPDLQTQQKIVKHLNAISAQQQQLQQHYTRQLQQLKALKASLLNAAFKGEL